LALQRRTPVVLVDADDVAPALAQRLRLPIEPNIRTAIDATEHGRGELAESVTVHPRTGLRVVAGVPNPSAWAHVRPGEVVRVIAAIAAAPGAVVVDGAGTLEEHAAFASRGRHATARALVGEADQLVAVCDGSPHGVARLYTWAVDARLIA